MGPNQFDGDNPSSSDEEDNGDGEPLDDPSDRGSEQQEAYEGGESEEPVRDESTTPTSVADSPASGIEADGEGTEFSNRSEEEGTLHAGHGAAEHSDHGGADLSDGSEHADHGGADRSDGSPRLHAGHGEAEQADHGGADRSDGSPRSEEEGTLRADHGEADLAVNRPGGDEMFYNDVTGLLWIWHRAPRRRLVVPGGEGCPFPVEYFKVNRWTRCENVDEENPLDVVEIEDNWTTQGACEGPFQQWTGWTVFQIQGCRKPTVFPWDASEAGSEDPQEEQDQVSNREEPPTEEEGTTGARSSGDGGSGRRSGGDSDASHEATWKSFTEEGIGEAVQTAAFTYVEVIDKIEDQEAATWRKVKKAGDELLRAAGTVERAAVALWIVREKLGRNNLQGVDDPDLDGLLHPDHLAYLREIRAKGMPARYEGERRRVRAQPHPRARENLGQVYRQLMKDVAKHRVLVVSAERPELQHTASSPFEAVPKMLPNRTLSAEVRLVHDQRNINSGTDKELHPPATQPLHVQVIRRILFWKTVFPKVPILMAKKDVAGAFRLLWVDPKDAELFAGDVPWTPSLMGSGEGKVQEGDPSSLTLIFLVSSFGFSGSPGEWTAWGRGTEEVHRGFKPCKPRRDASFNFDGKILVDDMVLVEPQVGLRPWVSSEVYEWAVVKLLGRNAINAAKDAEEGVFSEAQTVWGVTINTSTEKMSLPEARVLKGVHLLAEPQFNFGERSVTLRDLQRLRGIATGWSTIVKGLKNELKAIDRFLGGVDGGAVAGPSGCQSDEEAETAWQDLWAVFEDCRWLCSRSETWSEKFGGDIREALSPMERLALPGGQFSSAVFVSSDATPTVLGAIDWTHGLACREDVRELKPWIKQVLEEDGGDAEGPLAIHLGEMLSFVAFACKVGSAWSGKVVLYAGDNRTVYHWVTSRRSRVRAGRLLIRVLNLVEMRYRCLILGAWWRTYHNEDADDLTRMTEVEAMEKIKQKGWNYVDLKQAIGQALQDSERFGPCFLSWGDDEDRMEQMKLRELRKFRALHRQPQRLQEINIQEWCNRQRLIKDFEYYEVQEATKKKKVIATTVGPDPKGKVVKKFWDYLLAEEFDVAIMEGPRDVDWELYKEMAIENGLQVQVVEFLTAELGEVLVRRRRAGFVSRTDVSIEKVEDWLVKEVTAPSLGTVLERAKEASWRPWSKWETAHGQGDHPMLPRVGAHVWFEADVERHNVYKLNGPCRWPLSKEAAGVEELYVLDRAAPAGMVRVVLPEEIWRAQGRTKKEWLSLTAVMKESEVLKEGCLGTGRKTALALLGVAAELCTMEEQEAKAGMCYDGEDVKSLGLLFYVDGDGEILDVLSLTERLEVQWKKGGELCGCGVSPGGARASTRMRRCLTTRKPAAGASQQTNEVPAWWRVIEQSSCNPGWWLTWMCKRRSRNGWKSTWTETRQ